MSQFCDQHILTVHTIDKSVVFLCEIWPNKPPTLLFDGLLNVIIVASRLHAMNENVELMFEKLSNLARNLMTVYIHVNFVRDHENIPPLE